MLRLDSPPRPRDLSERLERHIQDKTGRRVRGLCVEINDESVVLRGRTGSYYVKQLAQHCVWEVIPDARLENGIVVEGPA